MSRILKFRAWDTDSKMWLAITGFETEETKVSKNYGYTLGGMFDDGDYADSDGIEVMQYIGLKDKNGREIYEGDIVKIKYFKSNYIGKVVFNEKTCGFEIWYNSVVGVYGEKATHRLNFAVNIEIEVIGNIYKNPELLEGEKC